MNRTNQIAACGQSIGRALAKPAGVAVAVCLGMLLAAGGASAQVFKWVGPDGKINYSDVPPPPSAVKTQKKAFAGNVVDDRDLPFSLAEIARTSPVTLYTGAKCAPCDEGRKLLGARGIPFIEKTVASNADIATLGPGSVDLPQLTVGRSTLRGFEPGAWNASLSAAGYPESNRLPKSYRNPAPQAAAPVSRQAAPPAPAEVDTDAGAPAERPKRPAPRTPPKAPDTNPAGLRF